MVLDASPLSASDVSPDKRQSTPQAHRAAWTFVRAAEWLSVVSGMTAAVLLAAIIVLMLLEIVWRTVFEQSLHFTWEYSAYAMAGVFLLGASYTLRCGAHVRVTAVLEAVGPALRRRIEWVSTLIGLLVSVFLAQALFVMALASFRGGVVSFTVNQVPLGYPQFVVTAGALVLAFQFLARLIRLTLGAVPDVIPADEGPRD